MVSEAMHPNLCCTAFEIMADRFFFFRLIRHFIKYFSYYSRIHMMWLDLIYPRFPSLQFLPTPSSLLPTSYDLLKKNRH